MQATFHDFFFTDALQVACSEMCLRGNQRGLHAVHHHRRRFTKEWLIVELHFCMCSTFFTEPNDWQGGWKNS